MKNAKITEIFSSIQGEGVYAGKKQIFVRFYGCNLTSCRFCDTQPSGYKEYTCKELLAAISGFKNEHHSISITGGEPLLQKDFLKRILLLLKKEDERIYLETNGTLLEELKEVIDFVDIIAMDFKLPSSTGLNDFWGIHKAFLEAATVKKCFVKAVVTSKTTEYDIVRMRDIIKEVNKEISLVLQPVTPIREVKAMDEAKMKMFQKICFERLKSVKIIPQLHVMAGVR